MLCILHIGLLKRLGCFLLKAFTSPSRGVVCCTFLSNVLKHMRRCMLLQKVKILPIFLLDFLEKLN